MKNLSKSVFTFSLILCFLFVLACPIEAKDKESEESETSDENEKKKPTTAKPKKINVAKAEKNVTDAAKNFTVTEDGTYVIKKTEPSMPGPSLFGLEKVIEALGVPKVNVKTTRKQSVKFLLFNQKNKKVGEALTFDNALEDSKWIKGEKSVFIIHGFVPSSLNIDEAETKSAKTSEKIRNAYIQSNRSENLVLVSWAEGSHSDYGIAAKNSHIVGEALGQMIISLKTRKFLQYAQVKLVGFSLGAHVAGVAGYYIKNKLGIKISEITGLDPAGPLFEERTDKNIRLDKTDAEFVQVVHCNMGDSISFTGPALGSNLEMGHVDFYPNGGSKQPGCGNSGVCSHQRCPQLYASTIRGIEYKGCECENAKIFNEGKCTTCDGPFMGDLCRKDATGKYYVSDATPEDEDKFN